MANRNIGTWRRLVEIAQAALILGLPFVRVRGESAFRFDIPTLRLHVFGSTIWMQEFFIVLIATIFFALLIILVTLLFGRVWCGWLCPQTVLIDLMPSPDRAGKKGLVHKLAACAAVLLGSIIVAASLIWYFVSPYEFIPALMAGKLGTVAWGFWITLTAILFLDFIFLRHGWCKTVCPYAMLQGVMYDKSTLIIELQPDRRSECINCSACVRECPTRMDIRKGADSTCINCAKCIDACRGIMGRMNKPGLIGYAFGTGNEGRIVRQNVFIIGGFAMLFLVFLIYLMLIRTGIEVNVLPHRMEPRLTKDNIIINAYVLSAKNMLDVPVDLTVRVDNPDVLQSRTEPLHLNPGGMDKFPLFVKIRKTPGMKTIKIKMRLSDPKQKVEIAKEANFVIPDEL